MLALVSSEQVDRLPVRADEHVHRASCERNGRLVVVATADAVSTPAAIAATTNVSMDLRMVPPFRVVLEASCRVGAAVVPVERPGPGPGVCGPLSARATPGRRRRGGDEGGAQRDGAAAETSRAPRTATPRAPPVWRAALKTPEVRPTRSRGARLSASAVIAGMARALSAQQDAGRDQAPRTPGGSSAISRAPAAPAARPTTIARHSPTRLTRRPLRNAIVPVRPSWAATPAPCAADRAPGAVQVDGQAEDALRTGRS